MKSIYYILLSFLISLFVIYSLTRLRNTTQGYFTKEDEARSYINALVREPLMAYKNDVGEYPTNEQWPGALKTAPADKIIIWRGPYITTFISKDPWGHAYRYKKPGIHNPDSYDLWSVGPSGINGATDNIGNW